MARVRVIKHIFAVENKGEINTDGAYEKVAEKKWEQNPYTSVFQQLSPIATRHSERYAHAGDHKEDGNPPDVDHPHKDPQFFQGVLVLDKSDHICPGLEAHQAVIDYE